MSDQSKWYHFLKKNLTGPYQTYSCHLFSESHIQLILPKCTLSYHCELHCSDVIMGTVASQITSLTQPFVQTQIKKTSKLRVTGRCAGNSPGTGEFPAKMASNVENVSIC